MVGPPQAGVSTGSPWGQGTWLLPAAYLPSGRCSLQRIDYSFPFQPETFPPLVMGLPRSGYRTAWLSKSKQHLNFVDSSFSYGAHQCGFPCTKKPGSLTNLPPQQTAGFPQPPAEVRSLVLTLSPHPRPVVGSHGCPSWRTSVGCGRGFLLAQVRPTQKRNGKECWPR